MNILLLGPPNDLIVSHLTTLGENCICYEEKLFMSSSVLQKTDFIVSFGYRHIIGQEVIKNFPKQIINLHISYLPWNRGSDPNLWSYLENTPKGVSIHFIDNGIDTGNLIAQKRVESKPGDTLRSSYNYLKEAMESLFVNEWPKIRSGKINGKPQMGEGSFHKRSDLKAVEHLLTQGWDTHVDQLTGKFKTLNND
jgi:methionyl-tRNA formyltransferase